MPGPASICTGPCSFCRSRFCRSSCCLSFICICRSPLLLLTLLDFSLLPALQPLLLLTLFIYLLPALHLLFFLQLNFFALLNLVLPTRTRFNLLISLFPW